MEQNRPRSRAKNVVNGSASVQRRGSGLGTGPVGGSGKRPSGGTGGSGSFGSSGGFGGSGGLLSGGKGKLVLLVVVLVLFFVANRMGFLGSGSTGGGYDDYGYEASGSSSGQSSGSSHSTSGWTSSKSELNRKVAPEARDKYTTIRGKGKDTVTIMVYLCGTDLESRSGMATADLKEMSAAKLNDNINLIVYTGGCTKWNNSTVSSEKNQIYQIKNGKMVCLEKDMGSDPMTKASTLTKFIQYCDRNFPADRMDLIFWDHGGGSLSGFGYDEKNKNSGSMGLASIDSALKDAGVQFDFIGFDACLMATTETALMLAKHGDYLIASEETEPGVGWYYTDWLTALAKNPSMPTIEIGKNIVDDFVETCAKKCNGQKTTLSVVDLAELERTVPDKLSAFATKTSQMIEQNEYQTVSDARYHTREFAQSSQIDQVDLVHLAQNLGTEEGSVLSSAVREAVKYNRTSANMTNAYGLSIYFPYKKASKVNQAVSAYEQIGMDSEYTRCIQQFVRVEKGGQAAAGGGNLSPLGSLLGGFFGGNAGNTDADTPELSQDTQNYISSHSLDASKLVWTSGTDGVHKLVLEEDQWALIQGVDLNVFYDDGTGYVDLGLDNMFTWDDKGNLIGDFDGTWLFINRQPVAYYHLDTVEEGNHYSISGYVPVLLNGERAELILVFDDANPYGYIAGARNVYPNGETETTAKNLTEVVSGDRLDFLCDYYSYDGKYQDSYCLGEQMVLGEEVLIGNIDIQAYHAKVTYRLTDIYQQTYWTPVVPN